jgi:hypothetical protein
MNNEIILAEAFKDLAAKRGRLETQIETLEEQKEQYMLSNSEFDIEEDNGPQFVSLEGALKMISLHNDSYMADEAREEYELKKKKINGLLSLDPSNTNSDELSSYFAYLMPQISASDEYRKFERFARESKQKYVYGENAFYQYNQNLSEAFDISIRLHNNDYQAKEEKDTLTQKYKDSLKKMLDFCDKNIKYLKNAAEIMLKNKDRVSSKNTIPTVNPIERRREEIKGHLSEINTKIASNQQSLDTIDQIYELRDDFRKTKDPAKFTDMIGKMKSLGVISTRNAKKLTYVKSEKIDDTVELSEEKTEKPVISVQPKELDSDYFRRPDTECIICFLGDSFLKDIAGYDNSNIMTVLRATTDLFEKVYADNNFKFDATGVPNLGPGKEVKRLVTAPYNFDYKRQGDSRDKYRIHAFKRHSNLLEELHYGKGNIIFFGALAPTDDKDNVKLFDVVGGRCIGKLPDNGNSAILKPCFDYIEHITRGYIPVSLLSFSDKVKLKSGKFTMQNASIENNKYISFDNVDENTKNNVKNWLDDYFIEQTNTLFEIKDMYAMKKGNTLD